MRSKLAIGVLVACLGLWVAGSILLCNQTIAVHPRAYVAPDGVTAEPVRVRSFDGATLAGSFLPAANPRGTAIIMHGHMDSRKSMFGLARFLVNGGYDAVLPDSRGHGESGGQYVTFGLQESRDTQAWVDWIGRNHPHGCVYGLGVSMGAANLIQSLPGEPHICAAVADSPFSTLHAVGLYRIAQRTAGLPVISDLFVDGAELYARLRYGLDLGLASPLAAIAKTSTPLMIIHGTADTNIPVTESEVLSRASAKNVEFWEVRGTDHVGTHRAMPAEYEKRVLDFFARHGQVQ